MTRCRTETSIISPKCGRGYTISRKISGGQEEAQRRFRLVVKPVVVVQKVRGRAAK